MTTQYRHIPVMLSECITALDLKPGSLYLDATLGFAGHSYEVAQIIGNEGMLIGIDQDDMALDYAHDKLHSLDKLVRPVISLHKSNFANIDEVLSSIPVTGIDGALFDLGVSSPQIDTVSRGFSFKENGPLDMRMDPSKQTLNAEEIINTYNAADLARILRVYGEEKWATRIASFIVEARERKEIHTSGELVEIIKDAIPASARRRGGHPAKRTFQALRIEVNSEFDVLRSGLDAALRWLNPGGRLVVLTYHSLEDKIVKSCFDSMAHRCTCPPDLPVCVCQKKPLIKIVEKKVRQASEEEVSLNPRSRSAKLRVCEKC